MVKDFLSKLSRSRTFGPLEECLCDFITRAYLLYKSGSLVGLSKSLLFANNSCSTNSLSERAAQVINEPNTNNPPFDCIRLVLAQIYIYGKALSSLKDSKLKQRNLTKLFPSIWMSKLIKIISINREHYWHQQLFMTNEKYYG